MGMSASQARYTILTARMSDTEYECQQINQQRLTLSNQMNAVYEALCDMEVPTPPSKNDPEFSQIIYKGSGADKNITVRPEASGIYIATRVISNGEIVAPTGTKDVSVKVNPSNFLGTVVNPSDAVTLNPNDYDAYKDNKKVSSDGSFAPGLTYVAKNVNAHPATISGSDAIAHNEKAAAMQNKTYVVDKGGNSYEKLKGSQLSSKITNPVYELSAEQEASFDKALVDIKVGDSQITVGGDPTMSMEAAVSLYGDQGKERSDAFMNSYNALQHSFPDTYNTDFTVIVTTEKTGTKTFSFCKTEDLMNDAKGEGDGKTTVYEYTHGEYEEPIAELSNEDIHIDTTTGYLDSAKINGNVVKLTSEKEFDENKYDDAVAKFSNDKALYDQEQNRLNHQTEIYERQDKMLELKLTRLDSERNALNTELEAVKKVIQDSIDRGFKTFSG